MFCRTWCSKGTKVKDPKYEDTFYKPSSLRTRFGTSSLIDPKYEETFQRYSLMINSFQTLYRVYSKTYFITSSSRIVKGSLSNEQQIRTSAYHIVVVFVQASMDLDMSPQGTCYKYSKASFKLSMDLNMTRREYVANILGPPLTFNNIGSL